MAKIKVSDLAKELKKTSKELLAVLKDLGVAAKTASSSIEEESAKVVRELLTKPEPKPEPVAPPPPPPPTPPKPAEKLIKITPDGIVVKDLADKMGIKASDIIKELMKKNMLLTLNQRLSPEIAEAAAAAFEWKLEVIEPSASKKDIEVKHTAEETKKLVGRPPVVTIMGHVDHGKTKLLDAIRSTKVAETEAGGITQHIGAYQVKVKGKKITFLDTPGHEAFTALRARGAKVTDIAILVVAADDGVMPQTIEAIDHVKAAEVPIIVAINKIDKPDANPDKVKQQLTEYQLVSEEWGGQTVMVPLSAKMKTGIDELLDMILLVAEMLELKANPEAKGYGIVIESKMDKGRGAVATVLIKNGTLNVGDSFVMGGTYGKVKALVNDRGERILKAPPATPVEVLGIQDVPQPGDVMEVVDTDREAKERAEKIAIARGKTVKRAVQTLENFSQEIEKGEHPNLNIILKTDVQGSLEALLKSIREIEVSGLKVNTIHRGIGNISESDVLLAEASGAIVAGFNVELEPRARELAESEGVEIRNYNIIYKMLDDLKSALTGRLKPEFEEVLLGKAEVRQTFKFSKLGMIAGSFITQGKFVRGASLRIFRGGEKIYEGKLESLKRFKDDVKEVAEGYECGVAIQGYSDFKEKDQLECFEVREKGRK